MLNNSDKLKRKINSPEDCLFNTTNPIWKMEIIVHKDAKKILQVRKRYVEPTACNSSFTALYFRKS